MVSVDSLAGAFEVNGYVSGLRVLESAEADEVRRQFDALEVAEGRERCQIGLLDRHFDQRFVWELATHPAVLDSVAAVLGPDVMLLATHFFCKYAGVDGNRQPVDGSDADGSDSAPTTVYRLPAAASAERFVAWHQDVTYWGL